MYASIVLTSFIIFTETTVQQIVFPAPISKRFIKFEVTDAVSIEGQPLAAIGELDVLVQ